MPALDLASINDFLRRPLFRAVLLSFCLHLALLALVQVRPMTGHADEQVIEVRLAPPAAAPSPNENSQGVSPPAERSAPAPAMAPAAKTEAAPPLPAEQATPALELPALFDARWYTAREVDSHPKAVGTIRPVYPEAARRQGLQGWVKLRLKIDEQGRVIEVETVEAQPRGVFDAAAAEAFKPARFEPARRQGVPVRYEGLFRVVFELE